MDITDLAKVKSPWDLSQAASERLSRQAKETIDQITRDVIVASGTRFFMSAAHTTRATLDSSDTATAALLKKLRTKMKKGKIPLFPDNTYHLYIHPDVGYDLKADTAAPGGWMDTMKYARPEQLLKGEIGQLEGFRIMEVVNAATWASSVTVYASVAVGAIKGWGAGNLQSLSTHSASGDSKSDVLNLHEYLGWKIDFGCAALNNTYYYVAESAATSV